MTDISSLPAWLGAGVLSAGVAAAAYVVKAILDFVSSIRERDRQRRSALVQFSSLLRSSKAAFEIQQKHVRDLCQLVEKRTSDRSYDECGYEEFIAKAYSSMTAEEKELHGIIRGLTEHMKRPVNLAMLKWIQDDNFFKSRAGNNLEGQFAKSLGQLEIHLMMWNAKYEVWIPHQLSHALVYLDDEHQHGIAFPKIIDQQAEEMLLRDDERVIIDKSARP
jgi:hypothetical protein